MRKLALLAVGVAVILAVALPLSFRFVGSDEGASAQGDTVDFDIDPDITGNTASSIGAGGVEDCLRVDVPPGNFGDGVADVTIDVVVQGDTLAPLAYDAWVIYEPTKVDPVTWNDRIKLPGAGPMTTKAPPQLNAGALYFSGGPGTPGDGTLVRIDLDVISAGVASFSFAEGAYRSEAGVHPSTTGAGALAINEDCPRGGEGPEPTATPEEIVVPSPILQPKGGPVEAAKTATAADRAKPRFRGELGDFVIVEPGEGTAYPCPEPYEPATNPERSELYFSLPGAVIDTVGSCQGTIVSISALVPDGVYGAVVGRVYFVGPKMEVSFDAPAERLKLIIVGGRPALAELPIPDCITCTSQVAVIERFPSEEAPGITVWAFTVNDLDWAIALAEQIMGVR